MPRLTSEQLEERRNGLGSSDIAAIAGLSRFSTALDVYAKKRGLILTPDHDNVENEALEIGHELEPWMLEWYSRTELVFGEKAELLPGGTVQHQTIPWAFATVDAKVVGRPRLVEVKIVGGRMMFDWNIHEDDGVPDYVRAQVAWQFGCFNGIDEIDTAALLGGTQRKVFRIIRDAELERMLFAMGEEFWRKYILEGQEPPIDHSETCRKILACKFPINEDRWTPANATDEQHAKSRIQANGNLKESKMTVERIDNILRDRIQDASGIIGNGWTASWKVGKRGVRRYRFTTPKKGTRDDQADEND